MAKPTDLRIVSASYSTQQIAYRAPIKFGGRVVTDVVIFDVNVEVETKNGRRGKGFGSMPMGNVWAWPTSTMTGAQTLEAMLALTKRLVDAANGEKTVGHPLEVTQVMSADYAKHAANVEAELKCAEAMPRLAQLVCASPLEAAIYDAYGKALEANAYNLLGPDYVSPHLGQFLNSDFDNEFLDRYTLREPKPRMPLYHLVGALDPLTKNDIQKPIGDGLPETLGEWIHADGLTHLKIKLAGDNLAWDVDRVASVEAVAVQAQRERGCREWWYSLDFNERCANVQYVLDFLGHVKERSPAALDRVQYIEQPTHRDLRANPENRMHAAARIKPVVIDESLVDLESLLLAREQGYSGVALKACKGQTEALLMGAAAQKYNLFLCVQDLTCVGASLLHSASIAARIPTVAAIESNGRQYCPAGNLGWNERYPQFFTVKEGTVGTGCLTGLGLY